MGAVMITLSNGDKLQIDHVKEVNAVIDLMRPTKVVIPKVKRRKYTKSGKYAKVVKRQYKIKNPVKQDTGAAINKPLPYEEGYEGRPEP